MEKDLCLNLKVAATSQLMVAWECQDKQAAKQRDTVGQEMSFETTERIMTINHDNNLGKKEKGIMVVSITRERTFVQFTQIFK